MPKHHPKQKDREEGQVSKNRKGQIKAEKKQQIELDKEKHRLELVMLEEMEKDSQQSWLSA